MNFTKIKKVKELMKNNFDLIISDMEPLSYNLARRYKIPLICFDNEHILTNCHVHYGNHRRDFFISKLIVMVFVPKADYYILIDFENTWAKMAFHKLEKFKELAAYPGLTQLEVFLKNKKAEFVGGFRDLDKIACLYFNYRIFHYGEKRKIDNTIEERVFEDVKADFSGKTQMTEEDKTTVFIFDFNEVKSSNNKLYPSLDDFNVQFRIQLRKYLTEYKKWSLSKAAKNLNCSIHTLKNYIKFCIFVFWFFLNLFY